jgi:cyclophilin family peptidyl-prolyl cis-trans isomerase/HEAT repeat protein
LNIASSIFFSLLLVLSIVRCQRPDQSINKFSDATLIKIADLKDQRLSDSLLLYFNDQNPTYRNEAVQAFGSLQDTTALDKIGKLLVMDQNAGVRKSAAFALGQTPHPSSERILLGALVKEKNNENIYEILQAYGRVTSRWKLDPKTFLNDSIKTAGLAWSVYRAGLRGKTDSIANGIAKQFLSSSFSVDTRLAAAHYFARSATGFDDAAAGLISSATNDVSPEVRMASTLALGKIPGEASLTALKNIIKTEKDDRVLVNAIRALKNFRYDAVSGYLYDALSNKDIHIGVAASEVIRDAMSEKSWITVSAEINKMSDWRIISNLYEGALREGQHKDLAEEIEERYAKATDPYERAALLGSLKDYPPAMDFVVDELEKADTAVIRSAAANTLVSMNHSRYFEPKYKSRWAQVYERLMQAQADPAVLGTIASALADSTLKYKKLYNDITFLVDAREKLRLPEHIEALQPIEAAIAYLSGKDPRVLRNEFNHPIDWALVKRIPTGQIATIKTTRGDVIVRLLVEESPGSVANFVTLANADYFDNKSFHRVVPNFVIQAGCKRGDGWGSEAYSIRSEFSARSYRTGSMGMASAGKDTEGTQWFITHSPTPHLDGRYSLFAEVIRGMQVVDYIQVGDKIIDVVLENSKAQ